MYSSRIRGFFLTQKKKRKKRKYIDLLFLFPEFVFIKIMVWYVVICCYKGRGLEEKKKNFFNDLSFSISSIRSNNHSMIIFIWFKSKLFFRFKSFFFKSLDLTLEDDSGLFSGVNTISFNGNHEVSSIFKEILTIHSNNSGLIGLGNIGKNNINHSN